LLTARHRAYEGQAVSNRKRLGEVGPRFRRDLVAKAENMAPQCPGIVEKMNAQAAVLLDEVLQGLGHRSARYRDKAIARDQVCEHPRELYGDASLLDDHESHSSKASTVRIFGRSVTTVCQLSAKFVLA
jgi:hypothetical protein